MTDAFPGRAYDLSSLAAKKPPEPSVGAPDGVIVDVTESTFNSVVETSRTVPVVMLLYTQWESASTTLRTTLEKLAAEYGGRFVLARTDAEANPRIAEVFQAQRYPVVLAVLGGQPVPLFEGNYPEEQVKQLLEQVLMAAAQTGITGTVSADTEAKEPELPPHHAEGLAAIEAGDWDAAEAAYKAAISDNPQDVEAKAALEQVAWMRRMEGVDLGATIEAAQVGDVPSQLAAADAELATGQMMTAFSRLLGLVLEGGDGREPARKRLLEYFEMIGGAPEVTKARQLLAMYLN